MSRTEDATAATQSEIAEALSQVCVTVEDSSFGQALLSRVVVETASCIAASLSKPGCAG
ncbi:MAG: hypothetical protein ND895_03615 [Pyrinomonadaceae bacterium]|nr:hypothetical protein [Pyrinomonadaceae bacterium]